MALYDKTSLEGTRVFLITDSQGVLEISGLSVLSEDENKDLEMIKDSKKMIHSERRLVFPLVTDGEVSAGLLVSGYQSDDLAKLLNTSAGNGGLHTNSVTCVALDLDSAIWIGTNEGPCIITSPEYVFTGDNFDASRPIVSYGDYAEYLLQNEYITTIAVDGANRKWIGTQTSGVYLISSDGLTQIEHFDDTNSPLLSNDIRTIAINPITGEVFFGTDKGIVSYKGTATAGTNTYDDMFIYPNPVRESFAGSVAIRGLVANSDVKITDIAGNIVYQTIAEGGQAIWNRMNFKGEVVRSGIYLAFCTSPDGTQSKVGKIAFVH